MAEDARVRYTKMMIQNSFMQLVKEKPFGKIKLKEVCALAGINHSTFYRYYKDIYDWKEQIEASCLERTTLIVNRSSATNIRDLLVEQLYDFQSSKELYAMLVSENFGSTVILQAYAICLEHAESVLKDTISSNPQGTKKWDCYYMICGTAGILECWVRDGMTEPPEVVADYIVKHIYAVLSF